MERTNIECCSLECIKDNVNIVAKYIDTALRKMKKKSYYSMHINDFIYKFKLNEKILNVSNGHFINSLECIILQIITHQKHLYKSIKNAYITHTITDGYFINLEEDYINDTKYFIITIEDIKTIYQKYIKINGCKYDTKDDIIELIFDKNIISKSEINNITKIEEIDIDQYMAEYNRNNGCEEQCCPNCDKALCTKNPSNPYYDKNIGSNNNCDGDCDNCDDTDCQNTPTDSYVFGPNSIQADQIIIRPNNQISTGKQVSNFYSENNINNDDYNIFIDISHIVDNEITMLVVPKDIPPFEENMSKCDIAKSLRIINLNSKMVISLNYILKNDYDLYKSKFDNRICMINNDNMNDEYIEDECCSDCDDNCECRYNCKTDCCKSCDMTNDCGCYKHTVNRGTYAYDKTDSKQPEKTIRIPLEPQDPEAEIVQLARLIGERLKYLSYENGDKFELNLKYEMNKEDPKGYTIDTTFTSSTTLL